MANRKEIFNITKGKCAYCGCKLDINNFHIDHFVAKANGGKNKNNLLPSCCLCNLMKSNLTLEEFRKEIENLIYLDTGKVGLINKYYKIKAKKIKFYFEEMENGRT